MCVPPRKVFRDASEDVSRTQVVTVLVHYNRRGEDDRRVSIRQRRQRGRVAWNVPRFQGRGQGVAGSLRGRPDKYGKGATSYMFFSCSAEIWHVLTRVVELLPRSCAMEATQTPEPIAVGRGNQIFA